MKKLSTLLKIVIAQLQELNAQGKQPSNAYLGEQKIYDIYDVQKLLNISESTYYRKVELGELIPRKLGKKHYYFYEDLVAQLDESKRRGRDVNTRRKQDN